MASYLTARQKEILEFIHQFRKEKGLAPTHREICERFGFSSYGTAYKHLKLLSEKGFLKRDRHQRRGMELLDGEGADRSPVGAEAAGRELPFLGRIAAGTADRGRRRRRDADRSGGPLRSPDRRPLRPPGGRRVDDRRGHPRRRLGRRRASRARPAGRDGRGPGRRRGDAQALLPGGSGRPPAAVESGHGAVCACPRPTCGSRGSSSA